MEEKTGRGRSPRDQGLEGSPRALNWQKLTSTGEYSKPGSCAEAGPTRLSRYMPVLQRGDHRPAQGQGTALAPDPGSFACNGDSTAVANDRRDRATVERWLHGCGSPGTSGDGS
ncbi:hypothetical protein GGI42DRAFT_314827 [Trichoderma sp. SZMC 28013]